MPDYTFANVQMPIELDSEIRILAAQMRITRSEFIRLAIRKFIEQTKKEIESESQKPRRNG